MSSSPVANGTGTGLVLEHATTVYFMASDYTPVKETQAIARMHRQGQSWSTVITDEAHEGVGPRRRPDDAPLQREAPKVGRRRRRSRACHAAMPCCHAMLLHYLP